MSIGGRRVARAAWLGGLAGALGLVSGVRTAPAAEQVLDRFAYPPPTLAAEVWRADRSAPAAIAQDGGVSFFLPFDQGQDRVFWERAVSLDLTPYTSFELEVTCDQPAAMRSLTVYFKSGAGWYIWGRPLAKTGRQSLFMLKGDFETEGRPAGWSKIEAIRLSPWKGLPLRAALVAHALTARSDDLFLVRSTTSTDVAGERRMAERITGRVSRWLHDLGVAHAVVDDDAVARGALKGARLAVLCYNPRPTAGELRALKEFVRAGGKLVVFYAVEPQLAELLHMRLGRYLRAEHAGRWSAMVFDPAGDLQVPSRVYQDSANILPAYPADATARVAAWWESAGGRRSTDPAWTLSPQGAWMSHVLLNDDVQRKKDMLLGVLAHFHPTIWAQAARRAMENAGRIDSFASTAQAVAALNVAAEASADPAGVRQLTAQAEAAAAAMGEAYRRKAVTDTVRRGRELQDILTRAYALAQRPRPGEVRGVWDHDGLGWIPGNWKETCRLLAAGGLNTLFVNDLWEGTAHYPSETVTPSATFRLYGDQLAQCLKAARPLGMKVHLWKVCWNLEAAPPDLVERLRREGRLQVSAAGATLPWLNPVLGENVEYALSSLREAVRKYPVDGVQLDYIRYPNADACLSPATRAAFEKKVGRRVADWPRAVQKGGVFHGEFRRWRADTITAFVRAAREQLLRINPRLQLSAAVYGNYPDCIESLGQDWGAWLKEGLVDFVCPMNYAGDVVGFTTMTERQLRLPGAAGRVLPGLGVTADEIQLGPDQVIEQILAVRRLGAPGFVLFDLSGTLRRDILPLLQLGVTRPAPAAR